MLVTLSKRGKKPSKRAAQSDGEKSDQGGVDKGIGIFLSRNGQTEEMFQIQKGL